MGLFDIFLRKAKQEPKKEEGAVSSLMTDGMSRGAINKAYMPGFIYNPPFGIPRSKDIETIRRLAMTPQAAAAIKNVIDVMVGVPWDIKPKERENENSEVTKAHIDEIKRFFDNPNTGKDSFGTMRRMYLRDGLELNSGIIVKEFNKQEKMVEMRAVDGATFLMNPNIYGKYEGKAPLMLDKSTGLIFDDTRKIFVPADNSKQTQDRINQVRNEAAYFQFGWRTAGRPVPFGMREIVWMQDNPSTTTIYGYSPIEYALQLLQTLVYSIEYNLDYFEDNNVPKGFVKLPGAGKDDIAAFRAIWNDAQTTRNATGQIKKRFHNVPVSNQENAEFVRVEFTPGELELIASTTLFSKLLWALLGVTADEMGFTENSNRAVSVGQDNTFLRKAIYPRLQIEQDYINKEILSEFGYDDVEFKFNMENTADELAKHQLYQIQLSTGLKTVNEIRKLKGEEPLEGGDQPQLPGMVTPAQEFDANAASEDEKQEEGLKKEKTEKKSLMTSSPVTLGPFEIIDPIKKILKDSSDKLIAFTKNYTKNDRLSQIKLKDVPNIKGYIDELFSLASTKAIVDKTIEQAYKNSFLKGAERVGRNLTENKAQIKFLAGYSFNNIMKLDSELKGKLREIIERALIEGKGIGKIADEIKNTLDIGINRAETIARTEVGRAEIKGELEAMKASGMNMKKKWLAYKGCCDICDALDGKSVDLKENFKFKGESLEGPLAHVNCRCTLLYEFYE